MENIDKKIELSLKDICLGTRIPGKKDSYIIVNDQAIGEGAYSQVYQGMAEKSKKSVAIKIVDKVRAQGTQILDYYEREKQHLLLINSRHVLKIYDEYQSKFSAILIVEYCNGGTLREYVENNLFTEHKALIFVNQILQGLQALYNHNISHRDLKPDNIMFNDGVLKLIDLGASKQAREKDPLETFIGSLFYMAPEVVMNIQNQYDQNCDIYSLGVLLCELLFNRYPYQGINHMTNHLQIKKALQKIQDGNIQFELKEEEKDRISGSLGQLIKQMVQINPKNRIQFKELQNHQLFKDIQEVHQFFCKDLEDLVKPGEDSEMSSNISEECKQQEQSYDMNNIQEILFQYTETQNKKKNVISCIKKILNEINILNQYGIFVKQQFEMCQQSTIHITFEYANFYVLKKMYHKYDCLMKDLLENLQKYVPQDLTEKVKKHIYYKRMIILIENILENIMNGQMIQSVFNLQDSVSRILYEDTLEMDKQLEYTEKSEILFQKHIKQYYQNLKEHELFRNGPQNPNKLIQKHMVTVLQVLNLNKNFRKLDIFDFVNYQIQLDNMNFEQRQQYILDMEKQML